MKIRIHRNNLYNFGVEGNPVIHVVQFTCRLHIFRQKFKHSRNKRKWVTRSKPGCRETILIWVTTWRHFQPIRWLGFTCCPKQRAKILYYRPWEQLGLEWNSKFRQNFGSSRKFYFAKLCCCLVRKSWEKSNIIHKWQQWFSSDASFDNGRVDTMAKCSNSTLS